MRNHLSMLAVLLVTGMIPARAAAQDVIREAPIDRQYVVGARGAAMGDNYVADTYDVAGMYRNPSILPFLEHHGVVGDVFVDIDNDYSRESISLPMRWNDSWTLGIGASIEHVADRADDRLPLKYGEFGLDVAVGMIPVRFLGLGAAVGLRAASPAGGPAVAGTWTLGLCYSPSYRLSYAVAYRGGRDGFLYEYDPASTSTDLSPTPLTHAVTGGLMLRLPDVRTRRHVLALSLEGNLILNGPEGGAMFSGGLEVLPWQFLALRVGYKTGRAVERARYGFGLVFDAFAFDYAISPSWVEPRYHQFTVRWDFGG